MRPWAWRIGCWLGNDEEMVLMVYESQIGSFADQEI